MGFKRCNSLDELQIKLARYEYQMSCWSESSSGDPYTDTAWAMVELMDMVKVLAKEVESLKNGLSKTLGGV